MLQPSGAFSPANFVSDALCANVKLNCYTTADLTPQSKILALRRVLTERTAKKINSAGSVVKLHGSASVRRPTDCLWRKDFKFLIEPIL